MPLIAFALATLLPAALLGIGAVTGGWPLWLAPVSVGLLWIGMDRLAAPVDPRAQDGAGDALLALTGLLQLLLLPLALWSLSHNLTGWDRLAGLIGFGLYFGQVGNPAAHELIHRADRRLTLLGVIIYIAFLFGHHTSAHRLVHHSLVATPGDPNSARRGLGFWRFLPRAWIGSFKAGYAAEEALRRRARHPRRNPYGVYVGGALALMLAALVSFGWVGLLIYLLLAAHIQSQLLLSDYVQHYGLRRQRLPDGRYEPVGPAHSWNAAGWYSSAITLNAPRHSDHHSHPARPYPQLALPEGAAMLPAPLPAMALIALYPPLWRQIMDPRVAAVQAGAATRAGEGVGRVAVPAPL